MIWTAFIWGLGVSCGASIGIMSLVVMWTAFDWLTGKAERAARQVAKHLEINESAMVQLTLIASALNEKKGIEVSE